MQSSLGRIALVVGVVLAVVASAIRPARAEVSFTEFALSDTTLNSSPETDFWVASSAPADADGDGDLDLLIAGYYVIYNVSAEDRLTFYRNDGAIDDSTWALTPFAVDAAGISFTNGDIAWADYDNDGDVDPVVAGEESTTLYRNDGGTLHRTFTALPAYWEDNDFTSLDLQSITWADYDNDGDPDLCLPSTLSGFTRLPTAILRNDGPGAGDAWSFTDIAAGLPAAANAVTAWGDLEGDGDLDLLLGNVSPWGDSFLDIYRNDAGAFAIADSGLAHVRYGMIDWGDADADGDLDVVFCGNIDLPDGTGDTVVQILRNEGGGVYTPIEVTRSFGGASEPWLDFTAVTWADYDSDGQVDLMVSGEWLDPNEIVGASVVYSDSAGVYVPASEPLSAPSVGQAGGAFSWLDLDHDGDLDYFVAGGYPVPGGNGLIEARTQFFRADASESNFAPSVPTGAMADVSGNDVTLSWGSSFDVITGESGLTYGVQVVDAGTIPFYEGILPPSVLNGVVLPERGNAAGNTSWTLRGLPDGTYAWLVRAVDNAFNGSAPATGEFTVGIPVAVPTVMQGVATLRFAAPSPNPSREGGQVVLEVERGQSVQVALFDVAGRRVATLHDGWLDAGKSVLVLDPSAALPNGVYFVRAMGLSGTASVRATILR